MCKRTPENAADIEIQDHKAIVMAPTDYNINQDSDKEFTGVNTRKRTRKNTLLKNEQQA